jgi:hypothetical protein
MAIIFKKFLFGILEKGWSLWYPKPPRVELSMKHVSNCKVLASRTDLLQNLPKNGVFAELGVEHGHFSKDIVKHAQPRLLHLVDIWPTEAIQEECKGNIGANDLIQMHKMSSIDFLTAQPEDSLDVVYIDTDHTYKTTQLELTAAAKAVKPTGLICGHDYTSISYNGLRRYGVVEAVNAFCVQHSYEFIYLTSESSRHISFALQKIGT